VTLLFVGFEDEDSLLAGQQDISRMLRDRYRVPKGRIVRSLYAQQRKSPRRPVK
jgi:hypothetical protein